MTVLVTGATGLVGRQLILNLMRQGYNVRVLSRSPEKLPELPRHNIFDWKDDLPPLKSALEDCECVIHLAGENIAAQRWTQERKKTLRSSRITSTKNICESIRLLPKEKRPKLFICASAIGFYGDSFTSKDETCAAGKGFLAQLCKDWESEASVCEELGVRTVLLRTGIVLSQDGGVLKKTGPAVLGDGMQWMSWIHIDDLIRFISSCLKDSSIQGPYNLTSPNQVTNKEFTKTYCKIKNIPFALPIPKILLKIVFGELAEVMLSSQKVTPAKLTAAGFKFKFEHLEDALKNLLNKRPFTENVFSSKQFVPQKRSDVFSFFSKAENLEVLTPPWLNFHITSQSTQQITKDTIIDYKLKIHGFPIKWKTHITEWDPESSFVDLQVTGPYKKWEHLHTFEEVNGGTLISDEVIFTVPGGVLGILLLPFIKKDIHKIFSYRKNKIQEIMSDIRKH